MARSRDSWVARLSQTGYARYNANKFRINAVLDRDARDVHLVLDRKTAFRLGKALIDWATDDYVTCDHGKYPGDSWCSDKKCHNYISFHAFGADLES